MAIANVAVPQFPDVPNVPGVPPMVRTALDVVNNAILLIADAALVIKSFRGPSWGIFDPLGYPVLIGDSVIAVDFREESRVSDYPVEQGGFASYDKVATPFDVRVTFAVSGKASLLTTLASGGAIGAIISGKDPDIAGRTAFLAALKAKAASLDLVSVHTPEMSYPSCNIVHADYRRESRRGVTLLTIDVWLIEIRVTATAQFTQTHDPSGADPQNGGGLQPAAPTPAVQKAVEAASPDFTTKAKVVGQFFSLP